MDALDILGGLLGGGRAQSGQSSGGSGGVSGGFGGRILEELIKSGMGRSAAPSSTPSRPPARRGSVSHQPIDVSSEVNRLEDLLGVAKGGRTSGPGGGAGQAGTGSRGTTTPGQYRQPPPVATGRYPAPGSQPPPSRTSAPQSQSTQFPGSPFPSAQPGRGELSSQDEAVILIRAMINAAKADGKLDRQEQEAILSRVPNDEATINFLRQEFAAPLDVREFAWSVPLGMEVQVYTLSLAAIQLDTRSELNFLQELAHGLRIDPEVCNQIHARYGFQPLY